jgi:hypothetical protein
MSHWTIGPQANPENRRRQQYGTALSEVLVEELAIVAGRQGWTCLRVSKFGGWYHLYGVPPKAKKGGAP